MLRVEQPPADGGPQTSEQKKQAKRAAAFNALNRNKRSMAVNLRDAQGQEILHKLVKDADVLVEGYRPGVVDRLNADYKTLSQNSYSSESKFNKTLIKEYKKLAEFEAEEMQDWNSAKLYSIKAIKSYEGKLI